MQSGRGYCSICHIYYSDLEQHLSSAQHKTVALLNRQQLLGARNLMERFLQDVLRHHVNQDEEDRSAHNDERLPEVSPEVAHAEEEEVAHAEEMVKDPSDVRGNIFIRGLEPLEELWPRSLQSQECANNVSVRPSVIQKLEKGQQHPLEFVHKIGESPEEFNPVDVGQATNNGNNLMFPSVIISAPASCLAERSNDKPIISNTAEVPLVAHLDSVNKCDPNLDKLAKSSSNPILSSNLETRSVSDQKPKESNRKSSCIKPAKLILQKDVKSQGKGLSADTTFQGFMEPERPLDSFAKLAAYSATRQNVVNTPSNKGTVENDDANSDEEFIFNMDYTQEGENSVFFNKATYLDQKYSLGPGMKFSCNCFKSVSNQPQEIQQDVKPRAEDPIDLEDKKGEPRGSGMSVDCSSSFSSPDDKSKMTAKETNFQLETYANLQGQDNTVSGVGSNRDGLLQLLTNQSQGTVKEKSLQQPVHINLVDQSYESSNESEDDFDGGTSFLSIVDHSQQSVGAVNFPKVVHSGLVDESYGSSSSEISVDSPPPSLAVTDQYPGTVEEIEVQERVHTNLINKNCEEYCSETSLDCEFSPRQSEVDHLQLALKRRNRNDRNVDVEDNGEPSSIKESLACDISLQKAMDEPKRAVEEIHFPREKNPDLVDKNYEYHAPEMGFHGDVHFMADISQGAVNDVNFQEFDANLEDESDDSSISDLSFDSEASFYQSANDQPQGTLDEINLKELSVDMEAKSYDCSSSELTFDSNPLLSGTQQSQIDFEEIRSHLSLRSKSCASDSSEITFDSDLSLHSVDEPQVTTYEERNVDLDNKSNESCISGITFDSDITLHSDTQQSEVAVKETTIQEEEHVHLERKNDESAGSERNLNSDFPLHHSVTNHIYGAIKKLILKKEEAIRLQNKRNEPSGLELSLGSDNTPLSVTGGSEASINEINLQKGENKVSRHISVISLEPSIPRHSVINHCKSADKEINLHKEEHVHLGNMGHGPSVSGVNLKYDIPFSVITEHPALAAKKINHQEEEHVYLRSKDNELTLSKTRLVSDIPFQSLTHQPEEVVEGLHLPNRKHTDFEDKGTELSGSEVILDSDGPHYLVTEPQIGAQRANLQKEEHVVPENKSDECSDSEIGLDSDVYFQSLAQKLPEDCVGPVDASTEPTGYGICLDVDAPLHSITDQPHIALLKEKCADLEEDKSSETGSAESADPLKILAEQIKEAVEKLQEEKDIDLENKINEPTGFEIIQDSHVSLQAKADEVNMTVKQTHPEKEDHAYLEDKSGQYSGSAMSLDSDFLLQSIADQHQIAILDQAHVQLKDKHNQSSVSEVSFDSDDPLQSVADQLQKAVKEISLWEDEDVHLKDKRVKSRAYKAVHDSGVIQSVAGQAEEVFKKTNHWKKHFGFKDKIIKPSDSDAPLQSVANDIHDGIKERNFLKEKNTCLEDKAYELNSSEVIYASAIPIRAVVEQPHVLEEEHSKLEDQNDEPCGPEINFVSDEPIQLVDGQLQKTVKKQSVWKEGHIYLGDKSYKLGDFEVAFDSDEPIQFVADQSPVADKEINFQSRNPNVIGNDNYKFTGSEINCESGIRFEMEGDQHRLAYKETSLQNEKYLDIDEKNNELRDSGVICASDVPLQIVVNQSQVLVSETDHKMVVLDLVTKSSDSDCEIISDSDGLFQPVIDPSQMTVSGRNSVNADCVALEEESCYSCDSDRRFVCEGPPQLVNNQSKEIFKFINKKGDCIILEEASYGSCGSEINFNVNVSHQPMPHQSQGSDKHMEKYAVSEDTNYEVSDPKRDFNWQGSFQEATGQKRKASKEVKLRKNSRGSGSKRRRSKSSASAVNCETSFEPVIQEMAYKEDPLTLKHVALDSMNYEPCGSEMNLHCDSSLQCDSDQPTEAVNKIGLFKNITIDLKDIRDFHSSSVSLEKAKVIEDDEPVLEALPHVPPSFVGKTWSQIMKEDDVKINALVKEFREGRFHCYFDDDCETENVKKTNSNKEKKTTEADLSQETAAIQVLADCDVIAGIDDFSVALDNPCLHSQVQRPYQQNWQVASQCQTVKASHGTKTNLTHYPTMKRRLIGPQEDSPKTKCLLLQDDKITKNVEFSEPCTEVLKPFQPNALVYVLSPPNNEPKEGESLNFSKMRESNDTDSWANTQYTYEQSSFSHYNPLTKQIVIAPLVDTVGPGPDSLGWAQVHLSGNDPFCNAQDDVHAQNATSSFIAVPVTYELTPEQGTSGSSVFLENSEVWNSVEVPRLNAVQRPARAGRKRFSGSKCKKKTRKTKRTVGTKPCSSKKARQPNTLQQNARLALLSQSIWMRTKPSDIIRKYIPKYSAFLRHRYQSRSAFIGMHLEREETDASKLLRLRRSAKEAGSTRTRSAGTRKRVRAMGSSVPKQRVQGRPSVERQKVNDTKNRLSSQKQPSKPVKIYALRSLSSQKPQSDGIRTRQSGKLRGNR